MGLCDAMRKAASLLVETSPAPDDTDASVSNDIDELLAASANSKTVEQLVRDADGPNLDEIGIATSAEAPTGEIPAGTPAIVEGEVTPAAIYQMASLPPSPFSAEQMLEMLDSLPQELPLDTRRQTVKVTLGALGKSMGATPETVVADASRKMAALTAYVENLSKQSAVVASSAETEIAELQAQIEVRRQMVQSARQQVASATNMCEAESEKLDEVLEFFSLDVAPSKYAPAAQTQ